MDKVHEPFRGLPGQVVVSPTARDQALFLGPDGGLFATEDIVQGFEKIDLIYTSDRARLLQTMAGSVAHLAITGGRNPDAGIDVSIRHTPGDALATDVLLILPPLNDGPPLTAAEVVYTYTQNTSPTKQEIDGAQPNSWSPATKLEITKQFLDAYGMGMPVVQLFGPVAPSVFSLEDWKKIKEGDHSPFGKLALAALEVTDQRLRDQYGTSNIKNVHFFGAGMGHNAIGAANYMTEKNDKFQVGSVTAQNLVLGHRIFGIIKGYVAKPFINEPSRIVLPHGHSRIPEPCLRREIDGKGAESAMRMRQVKAMMNLGYFRGMAKSEKTANALRELVAKGISVTIANARNDVLSSRSPAYLPVGSERVHFIDIVAIEGEKVYMMANEHAALVALVAAIGIRNSKIIST